VTGHSPAYIAALVDEALHRTPRGGFPELEKREGLKPGTLFGWVDTYGPPQPPRPFSALHVWIGTTAQDTDAFGSYFDHAPDYWELDLEVIEESPVDRTGCGLCIDLGWKFLYDEDLLHVMWLPAPVPVSELLDETTLSDVGPAVAACLERGIATANAAFTYADPVDQVPTDPERRFNGLPYVGLFDS
jgi:hypothetical protein